MSGEIIPKQKSKIDKKDFALIASGIMYIILLFGNLSYFVKTGEINDDLLIFTALSAMIPYSIIFFIENYKLRMKDENFPMFLRDLAMTVKSGIDPQKSMQIVADTDYGPLSKDVKGMAVQISWGRPFGEVMEEFGYRQKSHILKRCSSLIVKAYRAGGDVGDVLIAVASDAHKLKEIRKETSEMLKTYIAVIYLAYAIYIGVTHILVNQMLPSMVEVGLPATPEFYKVHLFRSAMLTAFFTGLVAGKIGDRSAIAGLKHSAIMILGGYAFFKFVVGT